MLQISISRYGQKSKYVMVVKKKVECLTGPIFFFFFVKNEENQAKIMCVLDELAKQV